MIFIDIIFVFGLVASAYGDNDPIVETKAGKVAGVNKVSLFQNKEYYSFFGIPYAEPPLGDLRFMPPKPKLSWDGVLEAKQMREQCAQFYMPANGRGKVTGFFGEEDCLFLNINTPTLEGDARLPVIVYTVNESFKSACNVSKQYSPDLFMEEGVVIVTFAHRLGSIGFLSYEDDLLPGNNGLRDIILVLEWVKQNIGSFGGDNTKVTLMGSNYGAAAVDLLLYSEKAKGLFSSVILQSGTSWNPLYFEPGPKKSAISLADILGKSAGTSEVFLKKFKKVKAKKLLESESRVREDENPRDRQRGRIAFGPTVEHEHPDAILTKHPENSTFRNDVPIMMGFNSREGIEYCARYLSRPQFLTYAERDFLFILPIRVKYHFKVLDEIYFKAIQEIKDFYFEEGYVKVSKPGEYMTYSGDVINTYAIDYTVRQYVNSFDSPVYYYTFDYSGQLNAEKIQVTNEAVTLDGTWGASLGDELCYLFICNSIKKNYRKIFENAEQSEEYKVLRRMVRMWSNFARTGNPTPDNEDDILQGFKWEPASNDNRILEISKELKMRTNPAAGRMKFWDNFLDKYEKLAVDGIIKDEHDPDDNEVENNIDEEVISEEVEVEAPKYQKYIKIWDGEKTIDRNIEEQDAINEEFEKYNAKIRKTYDEDEDEDSSEEEYIVGEDIDTVSEWREYIDDAKGIYRADENGSISATIPDKPVPLQSFARLCEQRRKFPVLYKLEFQTAVKVETHSCRHATKKNNHHKNQNQKVLPYDYNRVVLDPVDNEPDSDYINASYIDSVLKPNAYIVTQGPTEDTVVDFWRMIWQERAAAIVMLTKTFDFIKVMCVQYWPASKDKDEKYGDIRVGIVQEEELANFHIRTFRLYKQQRDTVVEERFILQFHYTQWHSHVCPFSNALLEFRRRVRAVVGRRLASNVGAGPMLVHCNDGGGRSGVYLAVDANLELAEEEDCFDVFGYLKKLRQSRKGLIENEEQYKFVYDTLEEHVVCGVSWFPVSELSQRLKQKSQRDPGTKLNEYQREYQQICKQTPRFTIGDCAGGHRGDNREKNRDVLIVPPDNFRPYLTSFQGNNFTDYINAVFVDGYTKPREYIVTEWPVTKTLGEFWSLVYDYECAAVVVLCVPPKHSQQFPAFWPEGRHPKKYGPVFTIDHVSHNHYTNIKTWVFRINKKVVSLTELMAGVKAPPKTVQLFQLTCWPMGHKVPTSTNSLVELMNMVERWRQRTDYGPVCVVSPDGRSRAGVYCAANACIEQVIQHGEVDIFQAVKTVRRHRPQLVENMTEYKYCYDLVLHYVLHYLNKDMKEKK